MPICLEIVRADGRIQRQILSDQRTTVGSSNEATICVPDAPELEPLHILVVPRDKGVWLSSARGARTPTLLDGKPFESGELPLGTEIDIGSITFRLVSPVNNGRAKQLRTFAILAAIVIVAMPFFKDRGTDVMPRNTAPAPSIFPEQGAEECPSGGEAAERRGVRAAERARSKTLRYPFDAREGLRAVELYRAAAPCLVGSSLAATIATEEKKLRQRIEDDYQIQRLHLERALDESDWQAAMVASSQLLALLADRPGPYRDYLAKLQRFLDVRISSENEKKKKK